MKQRTKESTRHVDAVLKTLDILDCFIDESQPTMSKIINKTGMTRSRAMRLIGTLESRGYLIEDQETKRFSLGFRIAILGKVFQRNNNLETFVRPVLKDLVDKTYESATFFVAVGDERVALYREEGKHSIRISIEEGQTTPIYVGAGGKTLLAFGVPELINSIIAKKMLLQITPQTITEPDLLKKELKNIQKLGYATSRGENVPDSFAVAAPIFEYGPKLVGAIGIAGPVNRIADDKIEERIKLVVGASRTLSEHFGYKPNKG